MNVSLISIFCIKLQVKMFFRDSPRPRKCMKTCLHVRLKQFYLYICALWAVLEVRFCPYRPRAEWLHLISDGPIRSSGLVESKPTGRLETIPHPNETRSPQTIHTRVIHVQHSTSHAGPGWTVCGEWTRTTTKKIIHVEFVFLRGNPGTTGNLRKTRIMSSFYWGGCNFTNRQEASAAPLLKTC